MTVLSDINGDGRSEIAISAPFDDARRVYFFLSSSFVSDDSVFVPQISAADADLIFTGEAEGDLFGFSIAGAGDVTGDGLDDFLVGSPSYDDATADNLGKVYLYSGAGGTLVGTITGASAGDTLGYSVAPPGDLDGDGLADILVGAPGSPELLNRGHTHVFFAGSLLSAGAPFAPRSAADADLTFAQTVFEPAANTDAIFGFFVTRGNDANGDGVRDIVVHGGARNDGGVVVGTRRYLFSGVDGGFLSARLLGAAVGGGAPPTDPDDRPGDDDPNELIPLEFNEPAMIIETILRNIGLEEATLNEGDLDADTSVTVADLVVAIGIMVTEPIPDTGEPAASTLGDADCLQLPFTDENGNEVDPCADVDSAGGGGPPAGCTDPFNIACQFDPATGLWDPCRNEPVPPNEPQSVEDCERIAFCAAANQIKDSLNPVLTAKFAAQQTHTTSIANAFQAWTGQSNPNGMPTVTSEFRIAELNREVAMQSAILKAVDRLLGSSAASAAGVVATPLLARITNLLNLPVKLSDLPGGAGSAAATGVTIAFSFNLNDIANDLKTDIASAKQTFVSNPARIAFHSAIQSADQAEQAACNTFQEMSAALAQEFFQAQGAARVNCLQELQP